MGEVAVVANLVASQNLGQERCFCNATYQPIRLHIAAAYIYFRYRSRFDGHIEGKASRNSQTPKHTINET